MKNRMTYFMQFSPYMAQRKKDLYIWALFELFIKISLTRTMFWDILAVCYMILCKKKVW